MAFRCENCNGSVTFDVASQQMKCAHCGSSFPPESFRVRDEGTADGGTDLTVFRCGGCGAELESTEDSMVGFCPYCGGQSVLNTGRAGGERPERILPFQISRESCAALYSRFAKKVRYLPREMTDPEQLKSFTGIYMPYYEYDVAFGASEIQGTKTVEDHFRYEVVNTYRIDARLEGTYRGVPFDASRYLDDEIAARTLPFDTAAERDFHPAYLAGFYADAATVDGDLYGKDAADQAVKDVVEEVAQSALAESGIAVDKSAARVEAETTGRHRVLYPLWFLTWRKDDRVAYAVINGQSGKVVSDLPLDLKAFALGCGVISVVLFLLLELLVQPTPLITSVLSLTAALLMGIGLHGSTRTVFEKQTHAKDKGWTAGEEPQEPSSDGKPGKKKQKGGRAPVILVSILVLLLIFLTSTGALSYSRFWGGAVLAYSLFLVWRVSKMQKDIPEKHPLRAALALLAAVILNVALVFLSPVSDAWYYLGDALCIAVLLFSSLGILRTYNVGTTRPLPTLFDRKEL